MVILGVGEAELQTPSCQIKSDLAIGHTVPDLQPLDGQNAHHQTTWQMEAFQQDVMLIGVAM